MARDGRKIEVNGDEPLMFPPPTPAPKFEVTVRQEVTLRIPSVVPSPYGPPYDLVHAFTADDATDLAKALASAALDIR